MSIGHEQAESAVHSKTYFTCSSFWPWRGYIAFRLREALHGEWIIEIKCLKVQLGFSSCWKVINSWMSPCWELIPFSSAQVLLCVPATTSVFLQLSGSMARNMASISVDVLDLAYSRLMLFIQFLQQVLGARAVAFPSGCSLCFVPGDLCSPSLGTTEHESWGLDPQKKIKGTGFWLCEGGKGFSSSLLPSLCPGVWRSLVWLCGEGCCELRLFFFFNVPVWEKVAFVNEF